MNAYNELNQKILFSAVMKTIEEMAFCAPEEMTDTDLSVTGRKDTYWAVITVHEPYRCEIGFYLQSDHGSRLLEDVYGFLQDTPTEGLILDTLGEILNTSAGQFMHRVLPEGTGFELGIPKVGKGRTVFNVPPDLHFSLDLGGIGLHVTLRDEFSGRSGD